MSTNAAKKSNQVDEPANMQVVKNDNPVDTGKVNSEKVPEPVETKSPVQPEPVQRPVLTLEQKMQKVDDLRMLIDKYQKLSDARRNLQSFRLSTDGMSTQIVLRDLATQTEFKTSNSAVVTVCIADMIRILEEKISEVEHQIEF